MSTEFRIEDFVPENANKKSFKDLLNHYLHDWDDEIPDVSNWTGDHKVRPAWVLAISLWLTFGQEEGILQDKIKEEISIFNKWYREVWSERKGDIEGPNTKEDIEMVNKLLESVINSLDPSPQSQQPDPSL